MMMPKVPIAPGPNPRVPFGGGQAHSYRFGSVEVDFDASELRKSGLRVRVQDQPLQVLSLLLRHAGHIVTREEFRKVLWTADTFVDFDHSLNSAVKRLRDALNEDPGNPRLIETVPRHGYRFIAPVIEIATPSEEREDEAGPDVCLAEEDFPPSGEAPSDIPVAHDPPSQSRRRVWVLALIAGLLGIGIFALAMYNRWTWAHPVTARPPLALTVLPFRDISDVASRGFVADGMTQELVTYLGKLDPSRVVVSARHLVKPSQLSKESAIAIGREAGAEYVLEGSTRLQGSHLRVAVQLIKVSDQNYVWAESYDGTADDILRTQEEIAAKVEAAVRAKLAP